MVTAVQFFKRFTHLIGSILSQLEAVEAQWSQREMEVVQEREESRKLAALFQKVITSLSIGHDHESYTLAKSHVSTLLVELFS